MDNGEKLLHLTKAQPYKSSVHALALGSSPVCALFLGLILGCISQGYLEEQAWYNEYIHMHIYLAKSILTPGLGQE